MLLNVGSLSHNPCTMFTAVKDVCGDRLPNIQLGTVSSCI